LTAAKALGNVAAAGPAGSGALNTVHEAVAGSKGAQNPNLQVGEEPVVESQSRPLAFYPYRSPLSHRFVSVKVAERAPQASCSSGDNVQNSRTNSTSDRSGSDRAAPWAEVQDRVTQVVRSSFSASGEGNQVIHCTIIRGCVRLLFHLLGAGGLHTATGTSEGGFVWSGADHGSSTGGEIGEASDEAPAHVAAIMQMLTQQGAAAVGPENEILELVLLNLDGDVNGDGAAAAMPAAAAVGSAGMPWSKLVRLEPPVLVAQPPLQVNRQEEQQQEERDVGYAVAEPGVVLGVTLPGGLVRELLEAGSTLRLVVSEASGGLPLYEQRWTPAQLQAQQLRESEVHAASVPDGLQVQLCIPRQLLAGVGGDRDGSLSAAGAAATGPCAKLLVVSVLEILGQQQGDDGVDHGNHPISHEQEGQHEAHVGRERSIAFPCMLLMQGGTREAAAAVDRELSWLYHQVLQQGELQQCNGSSPAAAAAAAAPSAADDSSWVELMQDLAAVCDDSVLHGLMGALGMEACLGMVQHLLKFLLRLGLQECSLMVVRRVGMVPELLEQLSVASTRDGDACLLELLGGVSESTAALAAAANAVQQEQEESIVAMRDTAGTSSSSSGRDGKSTTTTSSSGGASCTGSGLFSKSPCTSTFQGYEQRQQQLLQKSNSVDRLQGTSSGHGRGCLSAAMWGFKDKQLEESYQQASAAVQLQQGRFMALAECCILSSMVWREGRLLFCGNLLTTHGSGAVSTAVTYMLSNICFWLFSILLLLGRPKWLVGKYRSCFACLRDGLKLMVFLALARFGAGRFGLTQVLKLSLRNPAELTGNMCFSTAVCAMVFARVVMLRLQPYWLQLHAVVLAVLVLVCCYCMPLSLERGGQLLGFGPLLAPWVHVGLGACAGVLVVVLLEGRSRAVYVARMLKISASRASARVAPEKSKCE
jgi:hypothetical protein